MNKQKLDEIMGEIRDKYGLKSAVLMLEDDSCVATGIMVGSSRFVEELPEMALEAIARITKRAKDRERHKMTDMLADLMDGMPEDMQVEIFGDMPPEIREAFDRIMASRSNDKADKSKSAKATVSDILDRVKKGEGKDH